jgi:hypothetical protein
MKKKNKQKTHTVGTVPKSNRKIVERDEIDTINTHIHDCSFSWFGTGTSVESGWVKLVLWAQISPFSEMMWSLKTFFL